MGDRPRIELSTVQIVSSMGAAVTGAILTSYLGNGGTIAGTALGAGVSTAGFAVYKHYLGRTKEKVAPVIVEHARHWSPVTGTQTSGDTSPGAQGTPGTAARTVTSPNRPANGANVSGANYGRYAGPTFAGQTQPPHAGDQGPWNPGDARTRDFGQGGLGPRDSGPRDSGPRDSRPRDSGQRDPGQRDFEQAETQTMRSFGTVRMGSAGHDGYGGPGEPGDFASAGPGNGRHADGGAPGKHGKAGGGIVRGLRERPRWVVMAATTAAVFLVALLVITLIEFSTGKPIDASVWGRKASGTTLGNVTGGQSSNSKSGTVTPTVSPTPTQSATSGGGVGRTAPQPTSSATTAPTPSSVPSVSTAPSQNAPASVAPTAPAQKTPGQ